MIDKKQLEALAKKNAAKPVTQKAIKRRKYDDTLPVESEEADDSRKLFEEMKKREF
jgi:nicotinamide riboside kinase